MLIGLITPRLRLGFVSASSRLCLSYASTTPQLRLDYALATIACEHCRSSRNNPHYVLRHIIYYYLFSHSHIRSNFAIWNFTCVKKMI